MFFKSQKRSPQTLTFKQRVEHFWKWFEQHSGKFHEVIEAGNCGKLCEQVSERVDEWFPGFSWVFGPGEEVGEHSFTLTGEGEAHRRLLAKEWQLRAPKIPGWCFYSSRQRSKNIADHSMSIDGRNYKPIEFWVSTSLNEEYQKIDIVAWNPVFESMEEKDCYQVLFLWLDEVLGEAGTADWLGVIDIHDKALADAFPITELAEFVDAKVAENGWKNREPGAMVHLYRMAGKLGKFPRADTLAGSCSHMSLIEDYFSAKGRMADPLLNLGAAFVFVSFDVRELTLGKQVDDRIDLEEAIGDAFSEESSGTCLGGAVGKHKAYIDLLIYDRHRSWNLVLDILRKRGLSAGTAIHPFADDASRVLATL